MSDLKGKCLCGDIEYRVADNFLFTGFCHCSECRRSTGSGFISFTAVAKDDFKITKGDGKLKSYKKSDETIQHFCERCGSNLYVIKPALDMVTVMLGTLEDSPSIKPHIHVHMASKASWIQINDDLEKVDGSPV